MRICEVEITNPQSYCDELRVVARHFIVWFWYQLKTPAIALLLLMILRYEIVECSINPFSSVADT